MTRLNGCHGRADYKPAIPMQDGWHTVGVTRMPRMVEVPFRMSPRCEYTATSELGQADAKCAGCKHRATAEKAAQRAAEKGLA